MTPDEISYSLTMQRPKVDLPHPDSPTRPSVSPGIIASDTPSTACTICLPRAEKRLLIVEFGATWCPWCKSLQAQWPTPELLGHKGGGLDMGATFDVVEIGISTLHAGRMTDVASGHAVLDHVLAATNGAKLKSVPFLAVIDPQDRSKTVARGLDDFEQPGTGRHAPSLIRAYLADAHDYMRKDAAAPSEPGWLRKKFSRAWTRLVGE